METYFLLGCDIGQHFMLQVRNRFSIYQSTHLSRYDAVS